MRVWLLVLMLLPLAGCLDKASVNGLEEPGWKVGDSFQYEWSGEAMSTTAAFVDGEQVIATEDFVDVPTFPSDIFTVVNTTFDDEIPVFVVDGMRLHLGVWDATLWGIERDTLEGTNKGVTTTAACPYICAKTVTKLRFRSLDDGHPTVQFPLAVGDTWRGVTEGIGSVPWPTVSTVSSHEPVHIAPFTYEPIQITETATQPEGHLDGVAKQWQTELRRVDPEATVTRDSTMTTTYVYSPERGTMLSQHWIWETNTTAHWNDGREIEAWMHTKLETTDQLIAYTQEDQPRLELADLLELEQRRLGDTPGPSKAHISVSTTIPHPDPALEGELATVGIPSEILVGETLQLSFTPIGDIDEVHIAILAPDGGIVAGSESGSLDVRMDDVGKFRVAVAGYAKGEPLAAAGGVVAVVQEGEAQLECDYVSLGGDCPTETVPVSGWPGSMQINATLRHTLATDLASEPRIDVGVGETLESVAFEGSSLSASLPVAAGDVAVTPVLEGLGRSTDVAWRITPSDAVADGPGLDAMERMHGDALAMLQSELAALLGAVPV